MTWRIAWHSGFGGSRSIETRHPERLIRALRKKHCDWIEVVGATTQPPHSVGQQHYCGKLPEEPKSFLRGVPVPSSSVPDRSADSRALDELHAAVTRFVGAVENSSPGTLASTDQGVLFTVPHEVFPSKLALFVG